MLKTTVLEAFSRQADFTGRENALKRDASSRFSFHLGTIFSESCFALFRLMP